MELADLANLSFRHKIHFSYVQFLPIHSFHINHKLLGCFGQTYTSATFYPVLDDEREWNILADLANIQLCIWAWKVANKWFFIVYGSKKKGLEKEGLEPTPTYITHLCFFSPSGFLAGSVVSRHSHVLMQGSKSKQEM